MNSFNKRLEDFGNDLRSFNDYLEEVEDICKYKKYKYRIVTRSGLLVFNLINDVDVQQTQERIEQFRRDNKDIIATNISKQMNEEKVASYKIEKEKKEKLIRKEAYLNHLKDEVKLKKEKKEEIIRKLVSIDFLICYLGMN